MTLAARIEERIKALGTTARAVSLQVGPNTHLVNSIITGKSQNPRIDTIQKIAQVLQTNTEWLVHGVGDPNVVESRSIAEVASIMPKLDERRQRQIAEFARFVAQQAKGD